MTGWIADGVVDIVIGTHALIQEGVHFGRLGIAVVDEQHRFGVHQRVMLRDKASDHDPDLLRYLSVRGIEPAAQLEILDYSPFDNNLQVQVMGEEEPVVLGAVITNQVFVEISK